MLAFEIWVDDERMCLAGIEDWAILTTHITGSRHRNADVPDKDDLELYVGGMSEPDASGVSHHVRWKGRSIALGMNITIKVVETDRPDEPTRRYRSDHEVQENPYTVEEWEEMERADWLRLKAKFEPDNTN